MRMLIFEISMHHMTAVRARVQEARAYYADSSKCVRDCARTARHPAEYTA